MNPALNYVPLGVTQSDKTTEQGVYSTSEIKRIKNDFRASSKKLLGL